MMQKKTDEIEKYMKDCTLCPRNCHADRMAGRTGYCGMTDKILCSAGCFAYVGGTLHFRMQRFWGSVF